MGGSAPGACQAEIAERMEHLGRMVAHAGSFKGPDSGRAGAPGARGAGGGCKFALCRSTVYPPSGWRDTPGLQEPPENTLELEWIYGFRRCVRCF